MYWNTIISLTPQQHRSKKQAVMHMRTEASREMIALKVSQWLRKQLHIVHESPGKHLSTLSPSQVVETLAIHHGVLNLRRAQTLRTLHRANLTRPQIPSRPIRRHRMPIEASKVKIYCSLWEKLNTCRWFRMTKWKSTQAPLSWSHHSMEAKIMKQESLRIE